jgi:hypothetical protein
MVAFPYVRRCYADNTRVELCLVERKCVLTCV